MIEWLGATAAGVIIMFCLLYGINYALDELQFSKVPPVEVECYQLTSEFVPSTLRTNIAPVFSSNGTSSIAVYTTGHSEKLVTVWDCGKYGRLVSEDAYIYRYAKQKSVLYIRHSNYDTRIVGIKN